MKDEEKHAKDRPPPLEPLTGPARREIERHRRAKAEKATFFRSLALLGTIGWLIVAPLLIGLFSGRWLDRWLDSGLTWTLGCASAGLAFGGWMAWRQLVEAEKDEQTEDAPADGEEG